MGLFCNKRATRTSGEFAKTPCNSAALALKSRCAGVWCVAQLVEGIMPWWPCIDSQIVKVIPQESNAEVTECWSWALSPPLCNIERYLSGLPIKAAGRRPVMFPGSGTKSRLGRFYILTFPNNCFAFPAPTSGIHSSVLFLSFKLYSSWDSGAKTHHNRNKKEKYIAAQNDLERGLQSSFLQASKAAPYALKQRTGY